MKKVIKFCDSSFLNYDLILFFKRQMKFFLIIEIKWNKQNAHYVVFFLIPQQKTESE